MQTLLPIVTSDASHVRTAAQVRTAPACTGSRIGQAQCDVLVEVGSFNPNYNGWTASQLERAYKLPSSSKGAGQTVAIVDAYDNPYVGRDLNTIDISEQLLVCIGQTDEEVEKKWQMAQMLKPFVTTGIKGTPKQLIEELRKRVAMGITTFVLFFSDFAPPPTLELFAKEVMPAFA